MSLPRISLKRILLIVFLAGLGFSVALASRFILQKPTLSVLVPISAIITAPDEEHRSELPAHLVIPKIGVSSSVEFVGVATDGTMGAPQDPDDVSWFKFGPRPGEVGSAVIAGHYGWKNGRSAAFDNLYKLQKGDKVLIEDEKGEIVTFVVRESRSYDPMEDSFDVFSSSDGLAHLNLITCEGVWNRFLKSYSKRLVVFTDREVE